MASIRKLKSRIKTSQNISKITRAMEMVAASKMKKSQDSALAGRPYSQELVNILNRLTQNINPEEHPLLTMGNQQAPACFIVISTDKGLCGSLNTNLFSKLEKIPFDEIKVSNKNLQLITVGKKARDYGSRSKYQLLASFTELPDRPTSENIRPIAKLVTQAYLNRELSQIWIIYPKFISTISQEAQITKLLPLSNLLTIDSNTKTNNNYLFEPSPTQILDQLLPFYIENRLFQLLLEAKASEQSARMIAMKNAHDNAKLLSDELQLTYNRLRQTRITNELLDAISSRMALS